MFLAILQVMEMGARAADGIDAPRDYAAAASYYRKAAECGHIAAQYNLAFLYEQGLGVKQDFAESAVWYRKAADDARVGGSRRSSPRVAGR